MRRIISILMIARLVQRLMRGAGGRKRARPASSGSSTRKDPARPGSSSSDGSSPSDKEKADS